MFKVTDYEIIQDAGYRWIATDADGSCFIYVTKPELSEDGDWDIPCHHPIEAELIAQVKYTGCHKESLMSLDDITIEQYLNGEM